MLECGAGCQGHDAYPGMGPWGQGCVHASLSTLRDTQGEAAQLNTSQSSTAYLLSQQANIPSPSGPPISLPSLYNIEKKE